jgi:hypothetical protein
LQIVEDEIVIREENGDAPVEAVAKRRRIEKDSEQKGIGSSQDPFMKNVSRDDPMPRPSASGRLASQTQSRGAREVSTIAADFRALMKLDQKTRERVLSEATWMPWYPELVKMGTVSNESTDEQLDEIWVWCIALQYGDVSDFDVRSFLSPLAVKSMRGSVDRLRPVLARLLCLGEVLPQVDARHKLCCSESCIIDIAMDLLQGEWPCQESIANEMKVLKSCKTLSTLRLAKKMFKPEGKPLLGACFWHQSLVCFAFGLVFSSLHLVSLAAKGFKDEVVDLFEAVYTRLNGDIRGIVWVRLAALYAGAAAPLHEFGVLYDLCVLARSAPKELQAYLKNVVPDTQPPPDRAGADAPISRQLEVKGVVDESKMPSGDPNPALEVKGVVDESKMPSGDPNPANPDVAMTIEATEAISCPATAAPKPVGDPPDDPLAWRELVVQTLDRIVEQIHGAGFSYMSSEQLWQIYDDIVPAGQEGTASANMQRAVRTLADNIGTTSAFWRFFFVAERIRKGVATWKDVEPGSDKFKERKHFILRAFYLYHTLFCLNGLTPPVRAMVKIRQSETRELLDVIDVSESKDASRVKSILQDTIEARQLLCNTSLEQLSRSLLAFWKPQGTSHQATVSDLHGGDAEDCTVSTRAIKPIAENHQKAVTGELAKSVTADAPSSTIAPTKPPDSLTSSMLTEVCQGTHFVNTCNCKPRCANRVNPPSMFRAIHFLNATTFVCKASSGNKQHLMCILKGL